MDSRRLDSADVLAAGILYRPVPKTDIPEDREKFGGEDDNWEFIGVKAVAKALDDNKLVSSSNYYGIPYVWKQGDGVYRGTLLQYRAVTEAPTFATATEAAEWFEEMYHETYG